MKLRQLALALSVVGASSVGLVGCGGGSNSYDEEVYSMTVVAAYATGCTVTDQGGNTARAESAQGLYSFLSAPTGLITARGCTNPVTGSALPTLKTPAGRNVLTPITTLLANNATESQVRAALGLSATVNLFADPIRISNSTTELLKASVRLSALVVAAVSKGTSTADNASNALSNIIVSGAATNPAAFATQVTANSDLALSGAEQAGINAMINAQTDVARIEGSLDVVQTTGRTGDLSTLNANTVVPPATTGVTTPTTDDGDDEPASGASGGTSV